jgi:Amt family ammonium transporter
VRDLVGNQRAQAMMTTTVELARTMNLQTIAECVETAAIFDAVGELDLDYGQGFHIGRPRPLELVLQELLRGPAVVARQSGVLHRLSRLVG